LELGDAATTSLQLNCRTSSLSAAGSTLIECGEQQPDLPAESSIEPNSAFVLSIQKSRLGHLISES